MCKQEDPFYLQGRDIIANIFFTRSGQTSWDLLQELFNWPINVFFFLNHKDQTSHKSRLNCSGVTSYAHTSSIWWTIMCFCLKIHDCLEEETMKSTATNRNSKIFCVAVKYVYCTAHGTKFGRSGFHIELFGFLTPYSLIRFMLFTFKVKSVFQGHSSIYDIKVGRHFWHIFS